MKNLLVLFYGTVRDGKLSLYQKNKFNQEVSKNEGKEIALTLRPAELIRTTAENRYYRGVIVKMVSEDMGIIPDEAHDYLKSLFLKVGVEVSGKRYEIIRSTTALTISEFEDYCSCCREWASVELNVVIPLPNEVLVG